MNAPTDTYGPPGRPTDYAGKLLRVACDRVSQCCEWAWEEEDGSRCWACGDNTGFECLVHDVLWDDSNETECEAILT